MTNVFLAHWIRRPATTFHRATKDLSAKCRWCLSGTPIQNSLLDLGALLAFIQVNPFHNLSTFRYWISTPFEDRSTKSKAIDRLALLLEGICLRRTIDRVNIPGRREETRPIEFTPEERKQYENTRKAMQRFINEKVGEYKEHRTFGMFQVFLQLRSLCNHGTYQHQFSWTKRTLLDEEEDPVCSITRNSMTRCLGCRQPLSIIFRERRPGKCKHVLCDECSPVSHNSSEEPDCPICKSLKAPSFPFGQNRVRGNDIKSDSPLPWQSNGFSSKMARLVSDVEKDLWSTKRYLPS
jgi:SWI/SNF-related matrix-associated actin-dependent regulator of chromatin subfamily A3